MYRQSLRQAYVPCSVAVRTLAVVSRDGRHIVATGQAGDARALSIATNALFTRLPTDSTVQVKARGNATTRQPFWFLEGTLDDLSTRCRRDLNLP